MLTTTVGFVQRSAQRPKATSRYQAQRAGIETKVPGEPRRQASRFSKTAEDCRAHHSPHGTAASGKPSRGEHFQGLRTLRGAGTHHQERKHALPASAL